jgi:membrane-associated phospholipid phosphatase
MARVRVQQSRSLTPAEKVDIAVAKAAALKPQGRADRVVDVVGGLGDQEPMAAASATMLACGIAFRDRRMARAGVRMLAALGLATFIKSLLKDNIDRSRPGEVIEKRRYRLKPGDSKKRSLRSMPSGHSAGATAVLRAAAREYPAAAVPLVGGALGIAAAQLPTRNHFISDITAGVALGLACEKVASLALDRAERWIDER